MKITSKITLGTLLLTLCVQLQAAEWIDLTNTDGEKLFIENCGMCHRADGMGTGILARRLDPEQALLENRRDLQPEFIKIAVRTGFGVMFPMSRGEVSDEQLQKISEHLTKENAK